MNLKYIFILFAMITAAQVLYAQKRDSLPTGKCLVPESIRKNSKDVTLVSPTLSYSPETSVSFGVYGLYYFKLGAKQSCTRPSRVETSIAYTLRKQYWIEPKWEVYFHNDNYLLGGHALYQSYNEFFYGIGNSAPDTAAQLYSHSLVMFNGFFEKRLYQRFFLGPLYHFEYMFNLKDADKGIFQTQDIAGSKGSLASGLGATAAWDSRDITLTPSQGVYFNVSGIRYDRIFGSHFNFNQYIIDFRKYFPLVHHKQVVATQLYLVTSTGNPPFRMLPMLGGNTLLRGYYTGRFRDRDLLLGQLEYRFPVFWRIGMTLFGGAAQVANVLKDLDAGGFHYNYGFGLRYMYDKKERINIRFDFGFGEHTNGQYVTVGEAF
jgi:outer membrane protein assembly factor BamA